MKKIYFAIILLLGILAIYCLYPHQYNNAVLIKATDNECYVFLNGKKETLKISGVKYPANTVFNYEKNLIGIFGLQEVLPINNRILIENEKNYELESLGTVAMASKVYFFKLNNNVLEPCTSNELIIGKTNVKTYTNPHGDLMTFIISPLDYKNMRVGISTNNFASYYHDDLKIISSSTLTLKSLVDKYTQQIPPNTEIEVRNSLKGMEVLINNDLKIHLNRLYLTGGNMKIKNLTRGKPEFNPEYSGSLEFSYSIKGITLVNELPTEDYLSKVVPSEVSSTSGLEALKCQAVVARTYAIADMLANKYPTLGFYIDDSSKSQIYNNDKVNDITNNAIAATKDLIMTYNNLPIDAKYFSTSCGTGVRYEDVWYSPDGTSNPKPYFRTVNFLSAIMVTLPSDEENWLKFYKRTDIKSIDTASPYFRWNIDITKEQLSSVITKTLPEVYKKYKDYVIVEINGNATFSLPKLQNFKDIKILKRSRGGNIMTIGLVYDNATVLVQGDAAIGDLLNFSIFNTGAPVTLNRLNSATVVNPIILPSKFFSLEKTINSYTFYGGGYGHGVGMSQFGAINLSSTGWDFKRILNLYYKNIVFTKINQ